MTAIDARAPRVLVLWADDNSPNLGVRALARGTAALVRGVWPHAEFTFQNYGSRIPQLPIGRLRSLVAERVTGRRGMQDWLRGFDLIVDTRSGDSFSDLYGIRRQAIMTVVAEFAVQAGVPVILGPQTVGPFSSLASRTLARASLRSASLTLARDSASADTARALGCSGVVQTTDVVFSLPASDVTRTRDVVLNLSGLLWNANPHVDHAMYRSVVSALHAALLSRGRRVTLLAHVVDAANPDNDVRAIEEYLATSGYSVETVIPASLDEVRAVVASARVVVGSRMHACLNALSLGTAAVPLAYSPKFAALLSDLEWPHGVDLRAMAAAPDTVRAILLAIDEAEADDAEACAGRAAAALTQAEFALSMLALGMRL